LAQPVADPFRPLAVRFYDIDVIHEAA
jgi:hypothetical protein